jgi:hypothetical protein
MNHSDTQSSPVLVNPDNFIRAETDMYFSHAVAEGGFGTFHHDREMTPPMPAASSARIATPSTP